MSWMSRAAAVVAGLAATGGFLLAVEAPPPPPDGPATPEEAWGALAQWNAARAFPADDLPDAGYAAAFAAAAQMPAPALGARPGAPAKGWRPLGPHNIGGRTLALAFNPLNPHTIWAGTASGGLWRTASSGLGPRGWSRVRTGQPVLGVASIAVAPHDSNLIYIGTGEVYQDGNAIGGVALRFARGSYGLGVLKSADGGLTWARSLDWSASQGRGVQVVRLDPVDPRVVWAGTTEGTWKSTDAGASWHQVHAVRMVTDLVISPADPARVLIACGNFGSTGNGLYRTVDGGAGWTRCVQVGVLPSSYAGKAQLAMCAGAPNVVLAGLGNGGEASNSTTLCRSNDLGATWSIVSTLDYSQWQGWFSHDVAVKPDDQATVITAGIDVWKSTSGGADLAQRSDWTAWYFGRTQPGEPEGPPNYVHADVHDIVFNPVDPSIVYFATDGGVFRSTDAGGTFAGCNGGFQTTQFYAGFAVSPTDSLLSLGGMQDNATAIYDGSDAWIRVVGGDGGWAAIDPANSNRLLATAQYLDVYRSPNRGVDWFSGSPATGPLTGFIAPLAVGGATAPHVVYGGRSVIYRMEFGGPGWGATNYGYALDGNPALAIAVSPRDGNVAYVTTAPVGYPPGLWRTRDGGTNWTNVVTGLPNRYLTGLTVDPVNDRTVYVTVGGFGSSHLFGTTDGGATWHDAGVGLPDAPAWCVAIDPYFRDRLFLGNDLGVFRSLDGGANWYPWNEGLIDAVVAMDVKVSPGNRVLRLATHGNGVYERPLDPIAVGVPVPAADAPLRLGPAVPNPFNPETTIAFELFAPAQVDLRVYDARGRLVRTLLQASLGRGPRQARWDGRDEHGAPAAGGVYLCRLRAGGMERTLRLTLVR